ncbi:MAG: NADH-quinone oxidoreductase subunit NuoH [Burkholderiaceae bacterium]|jgi:NADH-quinone oxidoreductase subunit H|nr:NADH-quinone oxidoreductase subunit NuoH [Burkholderiaceae bacterium]
MSDFLEAGLRQIHGYGNALFGEFWEVSWLMFRLCVVLFAVLTLATFLTYWERRLVAWMHVRVGPNRTGPAGLLQPVADGIKLLLKEIIVPTGADKKLFYLAPVICVAPALAAWAVIPFGADMALAPVNAGVLFLLAITSIGVYGVIVAGWASNSAYALLGAMRAAAQMVSFGIPMGLIVATVLMISGSPDLSDIVRAQDRGLFAGMGLGCLSWNWLPLLPLCVIFIACSMAETARHPFDAVEGESEIVAGHMVEYSGMAFALFFLAEYANMTLLSAVTVLFFFGGWLPPVDLAILHAVPGWMWLGIKTLLLVCLFIWVRATFPRYRYDHTMRLGWKVFLPVTLGYFVLIACWMQTPWNIWH